MNAREFCRGVARHLIGGTNRLIVEQAIAEATAAGYARGLRTAARTTRTWGAEFPDATQIANRIDRLADDVEQQHTRSTT